jgi:N-formylmaleamate deformylase
MNEWTSAYATTNGIRLHYHRSGGGLPQVLLLHGITDNGLCWRRLALDLEKAYDLILVDARGHGRSEAPESGYAQKDLAADTAGLIRHLGLERPVLVGHSLGAFTAAVLSASWPGLARGIVLEDPPWLEFQPPVEMCMEWAAGAEEGLREQQALAPEALRLMNQETTHPLDLDDWVEAKYQTNLRAMQAFKEFHTSWENLLPRLEVPGLLLTGDPALGAIVNPQVQARVLAGWPLGRALHFPDAGHTIRRKAYDRYLEAVQGFLSEIYAK